MSFQILIVFLKVDFMKLPSFCEIYYKFSPVKKIEKQPYALAPWKFITDQVSPDLFIQDDPLQ